MAERTRDLVDVLRAAEAQRAAALTASPTGSVDLTALAGSRARLAVRAARTRRQALVVAGAAAAVAVVVAGVAVWSPRADAPPAGPDPDRSTSADVPGLSPLERADEQDVRGAPAGSALALWVQPDDPDARTGAAAGGGGRATGTAAYLLLVRPDGAVLEVGPAPEGAVMLTSWDQAAGTVDVALEGTSIGTSVVDVMSGRVVGTDDEPFGTPLVSPDGTAQAFTRDADAHVVRDGVDTRLDLPSVQCGLLAWADDAHLLLGCPTLDATTLFPSGKPGATTVLLDATTGAVVDHRTVAPDEPRPLGPTVRTDDGRLVAWMVSPADDEWSTRTCPTRLDVLTGLDSVPFAEVPSDGLAYPGLAAVPGGGLLVAGTTACDRPRGSAALWSVDADGEVTPLLPAVDSVDGTAGLRSWVVATPGPVTEAPAVEPSAARVDVGGLPPLLPVTPQELRDAPLGSVLALWTSDSLRDLDDGGGPSDAHVLLVRPDGEVRHVARAPEHAVLLRDWDRAAGTVGVTTAGGDHGESTSPVIDLLTGAPIGRTLGPDDGGPRSPDGATTAQLEGSRVYLATGDATRTLDLPSRFCRLGGWSDATHLLVTCTDREWRSVVPAQADGPALLLLDTVTGATQRRALVTGDVVPTGVQGALLDDGSLVTQVDVVGRAVDEELPRVCGTGLGRFTGLEGAPLPAVPAGDLLPPGVVAAAGRVLVGGPTSCPTDVTPSGLWALDLATGQVDELLPVDEDPAAPYGLLSWATWR